MFMGSITELGIHLADLCENLADWSQATFGKDSERGPIGALKHLKKEADEAIAAATKINECRDNGKTDNPLNVVNSGIWVASPLHEEMADCLILIIDAARRAGIKPMQLIEAAEAKVKINRTRTWPKPTSDEPVEHLRDP